MVTRIANEKKTNNEGSNILVNLLDSVLAKETSEEVGCDNMTAILIEFL